MTGPRSRGRTSAESHGTDAVDGGARPSGGRARIRARRLLAAILASTPLTAAAPPPASPPTTRYATVANSYVVANGARLAYRRIGEARGRPPLILLQHFTGTMDDWDSSLIDELARQRQVIILGNPGIGASQGPAPDTVAGMARTTEAFLDALGLRQVDLLGFSIGGAVAQVLVADRPALVRRLVLVGTGPAGGQGIADLPATLATGFRRGADLHVDPKIPLFFTGTPNGLAQGAAFMGRTHDHAVDVEPPASDGARTAQAKALVGWGRSPSNAAGLGAITQPVLIVNGSDDLIIPTPNSYALYRAIPKAQLILYPDSGHGSLFQYHSLFASEVGAFLDDPSPTGS